MKKKKKKTVKKKVVSKVFEKKAPCANIDEALLEVFKTRNDEYISGEELSTTLGVSRAGIWKHIEILRKQGYKIEAAPHMGYKLMGIPDKLLATEIKWGLKTDLFKGAIYTYEETESTNNVAYKLAENGAAEGVTVLAEKQSKGRGRLGREWMSPKGAGIYMSSILRPGILPNEAPKITLLVAVAMCNAVRRITGLPALIKWPNDILIDGKKVCGILTEMKAEQDICTFLVLGIGINVNTKKASLPKGATSLKEELGKEISRIELVRTMLKELEKSYKLFKKEDFEPIRTEWSNLSTTLGHHVKIMMHDKKIEGQALDLDDGGALIVRLDNGFRERVLTGR